MSEHATVKVGDFTVPLIGIPPDATQEKCDRCGDVMHLSAIRITLSGKFLCTVGNNCASRATKIVRLYARIPESPTKGEDRVKITSRFSRTQVYVTRLVKSSGRYGKRRYLIDESTIRREEILL